MSQIAEAEDRQNPLAEEEVARWRSSSSDGGASPSAQRLNAWVSPQAPVLYANPICSQLDQILLQCEEFEDVLTLLVTHRGVFFVHNLVTAMQVLAAQAEHMGDPLAVNQLLRDPRYDVLIRDLLRFVPKLDFLAMANVACALQLLDHKHYSLLTRMMRPLLLQPPPDVTTLLRCAQAYSWAGYHSQHQFYARCAEVLSQVCPTLSVQQIVEACVLLGGVSQYNRTFFLSAQSAILDRRLLDTEVSPKQVSWIAAAFAAHLRTAHDELMAYTAEVLAREAATMQVSDIARCLNSYNRVALRFEKAVQAGLAACDAPLRVGWFLRRRASGIHPDDIAVLLESAAYFGIQTDLTEVALQYLEDYSSEIGDRSAIQLVYAMSATGAINHSHLLLMLFRKIGAGSAWEAQRMRIFHLWVCQLLQFPWLDVRLKRRCLTQGLRAWCLHRRGYGCPFPDEARALSAELNDMGVEHKTFVAVPGTPYEIDIAVGSRKDALLVVSEVARNTMHPIGNTLLQLRHLQSRGWRCAVVPRSEWLSVSEQPTEDRRAYLATKLRELLQPASPRSDWAAATVA